MPWLRRGAAALGAARGARLQPRTLSNHCRALTTPAGRAQHRERPGFVSQEILAKFLAGEAERAALRLDGPAGAEATATAKGAGTDLVFQRRQRQVKGKVEPDGSGTSDDDTTEVVLRDADSDDKALVRAAAHSFPAPCQPLLLGTRLLSTSHATRTAGSRRPFPPCSRR